MIIAIENDQLEIFVQVYKVINKAVEAKLSDTVLV